MRTVIDQLQVVLSSARYSAYQLRTNTYEDYPITETATKQDKDDVETPPPGGKSTQAAIRESQELKTPDYYGNQPENVSTKQGKGQPVS